jgi:hypothetical protein
MESTLKTYDHEVEFAPQLSVVFIGENVFPLQTDELQSFIAVDRAVDDTLGLLLDNLDTGFFCS